MISQDKAGGLSSGTAADTPRWRGLIVLGMVGFVSATVLQPLPARAASVNDAVVELQHQWEVIKYQTANSERERRYEALATRAHQVSATYTDRSEALIWEGIIMADWASDKGGLRALAIAKKAKARYESAIRIDGRALEGLAYTGLAVLYDKMPGWPVSFGDRDKARELLQRALSLNPRGIDPNFFYGELLSETQHPDEALPYLLRALQAAPRPGRQISDAGRRDEVRTLIAKIKAR